MEVIRIGWLSILFGRGKKKVFSLFKYDKFKGNEYNDSNFFLKED